MARAVEIFVIWVSMALTDAWARSAVEKSRPTGRVAPAVPASRPAPGAATATAEPSLPLTAMPVAAPLTSLITDTLKFWEKLASAARASANPWTLVGAVARVTVTSVEEPALVPVKV